MYKRNMDQIAEIKKNIPEYPLLAGDAFGWK